MSVRFGRIAPPPDLEAAVRRRILGLPREREDANPVGERLADKPPRTAPVANAGARSISVTTPVEIEASWASSTPMVAGHPPFDSPPPTFGPPEPRFRGKEQTRARASNVLLRSQRRFRAAITATGRLFQAGMTAVGALFLAGLTATGALLLAGLMATVDRLLAAFRYVLCAAIRAGGFLLWATLIRMQRFIAAGFNRLRHWLPALARWAAIATRRSLSATAVRFRIMLHYVGQRVWQRLAEAAAPRSSYVPAVASAAERLPATVEPAIDEDPNHLLRVLAVELKRRGVELSALRATSGGFQVDGTSGGNLVHQWYSVQEIQQIGERARLAARSSQVPSEAQAPEDNAGVLPRLLLLGIVVAVLALVAFRAMGDLRWLLSVLAY